MRSDVMKNPRRFSRCNASSNAGFTLLEMMIALSLFLIISGAAFSLMTQHQPMFNQQQRLAGLNIALRNSVAQIQLDLVNGGVGYYQSANIPNWPVGEAITNNVVATSGDCRTGTPKVYSTNCFDSVAAIIGDTTITPVNVLADNSATLPVTAGTCASNTVDSHNTTIYLLPPAGVTAATYAANFFNGDFVLLTANTGAQYTIVQLSHDGQTQSVGSPAVTYVKLTHTATNADGSNPATVDLTGATSNPSSNPVASSTVTHAFCASAYAIRLLPILYDVDLSNPSDPKLRRTVLVKGQTPSANGVIVAEQIIGFKVGAATINNISDLDTTTYNFDASSYVSGNSTPDGYDYTLVRSVMISIVGRTPPQTDPTYKFRNTFDGGAYETQGISVVVNPRNMSMTD